MDADTQPMATLMSSTQELEAVREIAGELLVDRAELVRHLDGQLKTTREALGVQAAQLVETQDHFDKAASAAKRYNALAEHWHAQYLAMEAAAAKQAVRHGLTLSVLQKLADAVDRYITHGVIAIPTDGHALIEARNILSRNSTKTGAPSHEHTA